MYQEQTQAYVAHPGRLNFRSLFHWMSEQEATLYVLADHPQFPGAVATDEEYERFAETVRRASERRVSCTFELPWGKVSGAYDLVTGTAYLAEDGHLTLAEDFEGFITIDFGVYGGRLEDVQFNQGFSFIRHSKRFFDKERIVGSELYSENMMQVDRYELRRAVDALAKARKLPVVQPSVNGKRWGTFVDLG